MHCVLAEGTVGGNTGEETANGAPTEMSEVVLSVGILILEGRRRDVGSKRGYYEGPHCFSQLGKGVKEHECDVENNALCVKMKRYKQLLKATWKQSGTLCIEVRVCSECTRDAQQSQQNVPSVSDIVLEQWLFTTSEENSLDWSTSIKVDWCSLLQAVRSRLHFSKLCSWWSNSHGKFPKHLCYSITSHIQPQYAELLPGYDEHVFPQFLPRNGGFCLQIKLRSMCRAEVLPLVPCSIHEEDKESDEDYEQEIISENSCGRIEELTIEYELPKLNDPRSHSKIVTSDFSKYTASDTKTFTSQKGNAGVKTYPKAFGGKNMAMNIKKDVAFEMMNKECVPNYNKSLKMLTESSSNKNQCGMSQLCCGITSDSSSKRKVSPKSGVINEERCISTAINRLSVDEKRIVVNNIFSAHRGRSSTFLLGNILESVLSGRGRASHTVRGFTIDIAATNNLVSFDHVILPAVVWFYYFGLETNNAYLASAALHEEGYAVPKAGRLQITLFNTLGTAVRMFMVHYDLSDMPPSSSTFLRQNIAYVSKSKENAIVHNKSVRYVIEIRFCASKSGRIFIHDAIKVAVFPKYDLESAIDFGDDVDYDIITTETGPSNPIYMLDK